MLVFFLSELNYLYYFMFTATASGSELLPPPPLAYKKWAFGEQEQVVSHVSCGKKSIFCLTILSRVNMIQITTG